MYRYASYNPKDSTIYLRTWDEEGKRIETEVPFAPYLYVENQYGKKDAMSIFKTPLVRKQFRNGYEKSKYVKECSTSRLFGNYPVEQQFLIDTYKDQVDSEDFSKYPLKIFYFDIETYSPGSFPEPSEARDPVNLITIYDSIEDHFYTWGLAQDYKPKEKNVTYYKCDHEKDLFYQFLTFWQTDYCDILCGWNSEFFDVPYIINRIDKLFGEEAVQRLSPTRRVYSRDAFDKFGRAQKRWYIDGVSCIDYLEIYKTFSRGTPDSYALNNIAQIELGEGKVAFNATSLSGLSEENWELFVDYNIQDVHLLKKLDLKLNFLQIVRLLAYKGCTNFEKALGKVAIITGAIALEAMKHGYILATFKKDMNRHETLMGGYVMEPIKGIQKAVVSYDVNSLYPNTIITLNISPETKLGSIDSIEKYESGEKIVVHLSNGTSKEVDNDKFRKFIKEEKIAVSKAGILYSQKTKGVIPCLINSIYAERVSVKKKNTARKLKLNTLKDALKKEKTPELEKEIKELSDKISAGSALDWALKIALNSIYGTFANNHSSIVDIQNASSITHTGQAVVKAGAKIIDDYVKEYFGVETSLTLASDTDSEYITLQPVLDKLNLPLVIDGEINPLAASLIEKLGVHLNTKILDWGRENLNSVDPRFEFKREAIADVGTFLEKKRYVLHVLDEEGVKCDKFKYVGVELVRSTIPAKVKELLKSVTNTALLTQDPHQANKKFQESFAEFKKLKLEDICKRSSVKDMEKHESGASLTKFRKGTPGHVRAAMAHNFLLDELNLGHKYQKIKSGDKVKMYYAKKNPFGIPALAFMGDECPKELMDLVPIDLEKMFEKLVSSAIERLYMSIGWRFPKIGMEVTTDLFDLFS